MGGGREPAKRLPARFTWRSPPCSALPQIRACHLAHTRQHAAGYDPPSWRLEEELRLTPAPDSRTANTALRGLCRRCSTVQDIEGEGNARHSAQQLRSDQQSAQGPVTY
eukprot:scaffold22405_cov15-Tisochrysis_lutea.AAC.2